VKNTLKQRKKYIQRRKREWLNIGRNLKSGKRKIIVG
jgi:hypothetical protein